MPSRVSDFRSDTVTRPNRAMREAMAAAEVGDDVLGEDPTVRALEEEAAEALGKAASVFVPSGTMANQIAVHVHCRPGDELICERRSHVYRYEAGSAARLSGVQALPLDAEDGFVSVRDLEAALNPDDAHYPRSRLLVIEDTHNMAGGRVAPPRRVRELAECARRKGLSVHLDGARLANAAVACGASMRDLAEPADSVSLCLSKGLGAPVGSVIAGSAEFAARARRARKAFGGGMRQSGILAAAGLIALREGPARLARDHELARRLARGLSEMPLLRVDLRAVETNIVMVDLDGDFVPDFLAALAAASVLASPVGPRRVRFVTHRDVGDADVDACLLAAAEFLRRRPDVSERRSR
ncbi:MAG: GntG family PLP-dependent aldolase [Planctomycetota bacterium]